MTVELTILAWSTVLLIVLILISANANIMAMGLEWAIGNRDTPANVSGWGARARRTYLNHLESLLVFGLLVIVAHLGNVHTSLTVLGAQLFLGARIIYAVLYIAGVSALASRTLAFFVGLTGTIMIAYAVLTAVPAAAM
ncbi:MAG: MAPEG family protein [Alphaproteobacteria bacterium]|nr:MAPEG family protein [Alphaproteobacteria bacterium]